MRNTLTLDNYFDSMLRDLNRFAVGFEPRFRMLDTMRTAQANGFPPYDLEKIGDNSYRLSMAVAGYGPEDLEITVHQGVLTVEGKVSNSGDRNYLYKGIAGRSFKRTFCLEQYVSVTGSSLDNGVLTIDFVQEVPEALKPRRIEINTKPAITVEQ
jgi:molecular chaperone IbpA